MTGELFERDLEVVFGVSTKERLHLISNICDEHRRGTVGIYVPCVYLGSFQFSKSVCYLRNMSCFLHFIEGGKRIADGCCPEFNLSLSLALVLFLFI